MYTHKNFKSKAEIKRALAEWYWNDFAKVCKEYVK